MHSCCIVPSAHGACVVWHRCECPPLSAIPNSCAHSHADSPPWPVEGGGQEGQEGPGNGPAVVSEMDLLGCSQDAKGGSLSLPCLWVTCKSRDLHVIIVDPPSHGKDAISNPVHCLRNELHHRFQKRKRAYANGMTLHSGSLPSQPWPTRRHGTAMDGQMIRWGHEWEDDRAGPWPTRRYGGAMAAQ